MTDALNLVAAGMVSIGGGGLVVLGFSSWLGKVWAARIVREETHKLTVEVEAAKRDLDVLKENTLRFQNDKIVTYRLIIDMVARLLATMDAHAEGKLPQGEGAARVEAFNEERIRVYGYLAMLAPQAVMDAQDELVDYLLVAIADTSKYDWLTVRTKALVLLNSVRADIGISHEPITYNGLL